MGASACRMWLLGGFRVEVDGRPIADEAWRHRRGADLMKLLALTPGHRLHREQMIDALWPDLPPGAGSSNLRKAVHYARRAVGSESCIRADGTMVALWPAARLSIDVEEFEAAAGKAIDDEDPAGARRALELYAGEVLPEDRYEPWTLPTRERLRALHLRVLKTAGMWELVAQLDPLDEVAHRALMRGHLEAGNRQAAIRQFERLRGTLHEELGVGPDAETIALYEEVLALEGLEPATPTERARAHLAAGLVALNRMDLEEAEREARAARELAIEAGLGLELGEASGVLGMVSHRRGGWRETFREEFLEILSQAPALAEFVFDAHLCLAEFALHGEDGHERMATFARELHAVAEAQSSLLGRALATLILGETALLSGDLDEAETLLSHAAELHGRVGASSGRALAMERLAEAALARGRRVRARRLLRDARALALTSTLAAHLLVRVYGAIVELEEATGSGMEVARGLNRELSGRQVCEPCSMGFLVAAAVASARARERSEALTFLDQAERVAGMWQGGAWRAAVWEARGEIRLADGEPRQAAALFREAADLFARFNRPLAERRCRAAARKADRAALGGTVRERLAP